MTSTIASINKYSSVTVNPLASPEQIYELYSVPSFDTQYPEIITGKDIGSTKVEIQENDVLICKINPRINRVWIVKHNTEYPLIASSEWIVVRSPENDPSYLKWYFSSEQFKRLMVSQVTGIGGSLTRAQPKQVATYPVPLPDLPTQRRIATTLDKVSEGIAVCRQMLADLDVMVKARFVEMFGDPVDNPMGWVTKSLTSMGACKNGMNFHNSDSGVEINCLGVGDFKDYSVIDDTASLPTVSLNEMPPEDYLLRDEDIVFVRSNGNKTMVGRSVAVYPGNTPTTYSGFCIRYRNADKSISVPYLLRVLKTDSMRKQMYGRGANIQNLNQQILASLQIPVPPMELQKQYVDFVAQADKSKSVVQQQLAELETLKKSLMQEYFG